MRNTKKTNLIFFTIALILLLGGLVLLLSTSTVRGMEEFKDPWHFIKHQLKLGILMGIPGFLFFYNVGYRKLKNWSIIFFILNIGAMLLAFVPGFTLKDTSAYRWLKLGPFSFQPSEFLKITLILVLAGLFSSHTYKGHKNFYKTTLPFLIYLGVPSIVLFMQPSTSIVFLLGIVAVIMYLCSNFSLKNLLIILLVCISTAAVYGIVVTKLPACYATGKDGNKTNMCLGGYRMRRIQAFFDPKNESLNETYQPKQAKIGLGSGGMFGVGLGQSRQKYSYLPESFTDSIFAIIGEELGFFGSILIIGLFFLFYFSGLNIVKNAPDAFGSFLSLGLVSWITVQAYLHIMSASGFLPQTGIPLPFISYGGSLFVVCLWSLGILGNISKS